jgi:DNA-binding CsgD family transcriptional regulator
VWATVRALRLTAERLLAAYAEAAELKQELRALITAMAPGLLDQPGVGPSSAAQVLLAWSHAGRVRSEAALPCSVAPPRRTIQPSLKALRPVPGRAEVSPNSKTDARTQLRAAVDYLDRLDATPWAELARAELDATGATTPRPDRAGLPRLTPQELQVVRLAAQGLSNRDIAAQLVLSPRTVGYHLYKAYPKLGITSRSELHPAMLAP